MRVRDRRGRRVAAQGPWAAPDAGADRSRPLQRHRPDVRGRARRQRENAALCRPTRLHREAECGRSASRSGGIAARPVTWVAMYGRRVNSRELRHMRRFPRSATGPPDTRRTSQDVANSSAQMSGHEVTQRIEHVVRQVGGIILGKERQIRLAIACLLARGHLLIEDIPGVGKTMLAHALATSLGLGFKRIQFTSDLLPADIIGVSIYNRETSGFQFHAGPIFTQVVLADEVNRATPKAQSALLEAM